MIIAYFDCFSGISGDMGLGAMVDAGLDAELLRLEIDKLNLGDVRVHFSPTERHGIAATRAEVEVEGGPLAAADEQHQIADTGTDITANFVDYLKPLLGSVMPEAHRLEAPTVAKIL